MKAPKTITVLEHDRLRPTTDEEKVGTRVGKTVYVSPEDFEALKCFAYEEENHRYLDLARGGRELRAKHYVGVIETRSGTVVEVLPKITDDVAETRIVLLKMLRRLRHSPFKRLSAAHLDTDRMNLLEIYIAIFLDAVTELVRKGLAADYVVRRSNEKFFKGRLEKKEQIRHNQIHKERFFVSFDSYEHDRPENRIVKATLKKLSRKSRSPLNRKKLQELLFVFDEVTMPANPLHDLRNLVKSRQMRHYETVLSWCEIFLSDSAPVSYRGSHHTLAIMFDMNRIFEDYVAYWFKRNCPDFDVKTQHSAKHLLIAPKPLFKLRPDLLIGDEILADTKWKILDEKSKRYGLSQQDLYQMFAYGKKYEKSKTLYLIYPKSQGFTTSQVEPFYYEEGMALRLLCFDCMNDAFVNHDFEGSAA